MRVSSVLLISALCAIALSQSLTFVNQTFYPAGNSTNLLKTGSGYVFGESYYNFNAGQAHQVAPSAVCNFPGSVLAVNNQNQYFCFNKNGSTISLVTVDPVTLNILTSIPYTGHNTEYLLANGQNIILISGITKRNISAEVYNPATNSFFCPVSGVTYPSTEELADLALYGESLILLTINGHTINTTMFYNVPCSSGLPIPSKLSEARYDLIPLNTSGNSPVLLSQTIFIQNEMEFVALAAVYFDLLGVPRFGPEIVLEDVAFPVNDTTMLLLEQNAAGTLDFLFAVVTPQLTLLITGNISTQINTEPSFCVGPIANSTSALLTDSGFFLFVFDYAKQEITGIWNLEYQYLLSNGSYIFLSELGYFIQNPAGDIHWIHSAPYFEIIVSNDGNTVWAMYNPKFIPMPGYLKCTLLEVNLVTSTINEFTFNDCPCNENGGGFITMDLHAVDVDSFGNPHVLYTCNYDDLYLLNQSQVLTTWTDKKLTFFNGPFYFNLSQLLVTVINPAPENTTGFNVYLNNKTTSKAVLFSDSKISAAAPLNNNYCVVGFQYSKNATYYVVQIPSLEIVTKVHTETAFQFNLATKIMDFVVLGGDNVSSDFSVIASEVGLKNLALISPNGTYSNSSFALETEGIFGTSNPNQLYYFGDVNNTMIAIQLYDLSS